MRSNPAHSSVDRSEFWSDHISRWNKSGLSKPEVVPLSFPVQTPVPGQRPALSVKVGSSFGLFTEEILAHNIVNIDETTVQVLQEENRADTYTSYIWVLLGGNLERPTVFYDYHPTRGSQALDFLQDFTGTIQTDGYVSYNALGELPGIIHVGCLAHVRRKFMDVIKISKREKKGGIAQEVIDLISQIYDLEKALVQQKLEPDRIKEERHKHIVPILDSIKAILDQRSTTTPPKRQLGKAIAYALKQWERIVRYTEDG